LNKVENSNKFAKAISYGNPFVLYHCSSKFKDMKRLPVIFFGFFIWMLAAHAVLGQTRRPAGSSVETQVKPKFSEMMDYGIPQGRGVHEFPGGKPSESYQINRDGSVKIGRTEEITVPVEQDSLTRGDRKKPDNAAVEKGTKEKQRIRKP
jgi:hypothetical protein